MTVRRKTLLIIGATFFSLVMILYLVSRGILIGSFAELEKRDTRQNVERVLTALSNDISLLEATVADWASWDDTYAFIENINNDYIETNLVAGTFAGLRLNFMLFVGNSGQVIFGKAFDLNNEEEIPVAPSLLKHLVANRLLTRHFDTESSVAGLILVPEGPMLVASRPILTSGDEGPIRGALLMGRYLDATEIDRLAETILLPLAVYRLGNVRMPSDFEAVRLSLSPEAPILVRPLSAQSIAGYALLVDIYQRPILLARVDMPRDIYALGQATVSYFVLALLIVGVVFGVVMLLFLDRQVFFRLTRLSRGVRDIGVSGDLSVRLPATGKDELSNLGATLNAMMAILEQSSDLLKEKNQRLDTQNEELRHEITARKQAEELYRVLAEGSPIGVYIMQDGRFCFVNPQFQKYIGFKEDELLNMAPFELVHPEDREGVRENAVRMLRGNLSSPYHFRVINRGGETRWAMETVVSIYYKGKRATLGNFMDITERQRMEQEIQEKNERLVAQQQELEEKSRELALASQHKSEFLAHISHEFRTSLNAVIGFSELLLDGVPGEINDEQGQCLKDILNSGQHLVNLISDVLDLSKVEAGKMALKPENLNLADVIDDAVATVRPMVDDNRHVLTVSIAEGLPQVHADRGRLKQILLNLLSNAIKFTPSGGRLQIEAKREGDWCRVSMVDNGIGIKKEDQERIFEPFCQLDSPLLAVKGGTGLGLALTRQLVEMGGGKIWVESDYGKGSRFTFTIALAAKEAVSRRA